MSLLDDARRLERFAHDMRCDGFGCLWTSHAPSCPMRVVPTIVAALEAAERLSKLIAQEHHHHREDVRPTVDGQGTYSWCPSCDMSWPCRWSEVLKENETLVAASRAKEVTA